MRKITTVLMLVAVGFAWVAADCSARTVDPGQDNAGVQKRRGKADGQRRGPDRDPAKRVAKIIEQFDTDADQKLDAAELQEFLASAAQRRGQGPRGAGRQGGKGDAEMGGEKRGKRGGRKGKKQSEGGTDFRGVTPNRPPSK